MKLRSWLIMSISASAAAVGGVALAQPAGGSNLLGTNCDAPPVWHCPDEHCLSAVVTQPGNNIEPKTRRTYFLDCPAGYRPGDKVTLVLSLHGGGSYANWQRNYFPVMDVKDKHKLVVMTPGSPSRAWGADDDVYLQNIVDSVVAAVGKPNVERFILAGHSQGGATSARIICTPYFRDKVDVRISLSGGRIGPTNPGRGFNNGGAPVWQQNPDQPPAAAAGRGGRGGAAAAPPAAGRGGAAPAAPAGGRGGAAQAGPPGGDCDYSFIYTAGEYENTPQADSPLATKYGCRSRERRPDAVDQKKGYVWDATRQDPGSDGWGHYPRSGRAQIWVYPGCRDGRVVADVSRLQKGHTEGLEPNVTDAIITLAMSASGGKIKNGAWNPPPPPAGAGRGGLGAPPGGAGRGGPPPAGGRGG